jgi:protein-disulfide isomerase
VDREERTLFPDMEGRMAFDLNRAANVATIVVAVCATLATASLLTGAGANRERARPAARPDSVKVPNWEKYLVGGHSRGPANALVTILEFGDYECPFCARYAAKVDSILAAYPAEVRFVYRHWPLPNHRFAYPAARAAECAHHQERFWQVHDLLYAKRDSLGIISFSEFGRRAGVPDARAFDACLADSKPVPVIEQGIRDAQASGGTGTPTLIVNGLMIRRADSAYIARLLKGLRKD